MACLTAGVGAREGSGLVGGVRQWRCMDKNVTQALRASETQEGWVPEAEDPGRRRSAVPA